MVPQFFGPLAIASLRRAALELCLLGLLTAAIPAALRAQATTPEFNYSTVTVGSSATYTMTFTFSASTTLGSVNVVTQGVTGFDFQRSFFSPGSCGAATYAANATCTVNVVFQPVVSGSRYGAVVLYNNAGTPVVVGTGYLAGIGGGPQVVLYPGTNNASLFTGFYNPDGLFVDPSGSVFIADSVNQRLVKETYSGGTYSGSVIAGGLGFYAGPSVDGAGNIYGGVDAYSSLANQVDEFQLSGNSYVGSTIGSGWNGVRTTAVDSVGNVYVTNQGTASVIEEPYGYTSQATVVNGLNQPSGVGVDLAGNVYVADSSNSRVIEMTPTGGGSFTLSNTIGSGLTFPADVKTDGNGNVYIADYINYNSGRVLLETLSAGIYTQSVIASSGADAYSVAVDGKGNVYYAGVDNNTVGEVDVADPTDLHLPHDGIECDEFSYHCDAGQHRQRGPEHQRTHRGQQHHRRLRFRHQHLCDRHACF